MARAQPNRAQSGKGRRCPPRRSESNIALRLDLARPENRAVVPRLGHMAAETSATRLVGDGTPVDDRKASEASTEGPAIIDSRQLKIEEKRFFVCIAIFPIIDSFEHAEPWASPHPLASQHPC